jgi:hypothetical protein
MDELVQLQLHGGRGGRRRDGWASAVRVQVVAAVTRCIRRTTEISTLRKLRQTSFSTADRFAIPTMHTDLFILNINYSKPYPNNLEQSTTLTTRAKTYKTGIGE